MMKRILIPTVIAMTVSGAALAQQAEDSVETTTQNMTDSVETTVDNAADEAESAMDNMASEGEEVLDDMAAEGDAAMDEMASEGDAMREDLMGDERPMLRNPGTIVREGYIPVEPIDMTAENLTGTRVYDANDEDIGEIGELLISEDGTAVDQVVVDVGGFLGMGEHAVAVTMEELHIMRSEDGADFRAYMDATQEELEAQPEYEG